MSVGKPYRPVKSGQPLTAAGMNRNVVGGLQRGAMFSGNVNRRNFPDGVALDIPGGQAIPGSSVYQKLVEIQTIEDDYYTVLVYNPVSESTDGAEFGVAKTYTQQVSVYPSATESHEVGDIIVALRTTSNVVVGGEHLQWVEAGSGGGGAAIKSADNKTALTAILNEGELGYTTGTTKRGYWRIDSTTICVTHLE
jgi:hypothetical protein